MRRSLFVILLAAVLGLAGCGQGGFSKKASEGKGNVLRYAIPNKPTTLDPGKVQDGDTIDMIQQMYEGLVAWDTDNKVHPLLAESWDVKDNGKIYIFHLKKGVKFHNGREVKAEDFKWTWERNCSKELASPMPAGYMTDVLGVNEMIAGTAKEISGVKVIDDHTLSVELTQPRPYFLGKMTYQVFSVIAKEAQKGNAEMTGVENMVGTGPFKAKQYVPDQLMVLEKNTDYHGGAPPLDTIERPFILDPTTRLNKFKSGELDLLYVQREDVEGLKKDPVLSKELHYYDRPSIWYVGLAPNGHYKPFLDRNVRRAFAMAIDRKTIVDTYLGGINQEAHSIIPPGVFGHRDTANEIPYNPEEAKKLLAAAGYPGGKGMPALEIRCRQGYRDITTVAEAVASQITKTLGVQVNVRETEWKAYLERYNRGDNEFYHMRWAADYLDPQNFISQMLASFGPENHFGYKNVTVDQLCQKADAIMDEKQRTSLYQQAEDMILQDAVWVPIYFQRDVELANPRVKDMRESLFGHLPHTKTRLE
jgi:oligopeptide transport system substrate-binding protein